MGFENLVENTMFKFPKFIEVMAGIIKIAKSIEVDDPEKKFGDALQQWALRRDRSQGKSCLCRRWNIERWFYATKVNHVCSVEKLLEIGFVVPNEIIFVLRTEC